MIDIDYLAEKTRLPQEQVKSIAFWIVDHFMSNVSEEVINCGAYYNSPLNGDTNMIKSYQEILWAQYEELEGKCPAVAGPWITVDLENGIAVHKERPYK